LARISGVDLPKDKLIEYALTYIYGIGLTRARNIVKECNISSQKRVKDLIEGEVVLLREKIGRHVVEGDLKRQINLNIRRLLDISSYRGYRHRRNLPVRGQRTHTNARTRRGRGVAIAGKKKATKK